MADDSPFQIPAERPEDSLDFSSPEQKKADAAISKAYPSKGDDTPKGASKPVLEIDET